MSEDDVSPSDAFAALGDETRIAIVRELGADGDPLSFSQLRERVGVRDSGRFNYHLGKLVGTFVRRAEDSRYELTYAGSQVVGAVLAGEYGRRGDLESFSLEETCFTCDTPLEARYSAEQVTIQCPACEEFHSNFGFPPGAVDGRTLEELIDAFDRYLKNGVRQMVDGLCPNCFGTVHGRLARGVTPALSDETVGIALECERCPNSAELSVNSYLFFHPAVITHYYDHGIDISVTPFWNLEFVITDSATVIDGDPLSVRSELDLDGDVLELFVEEDLAVRVDD